jgi:hypothetical protein
LTNETSPNTQPSAQRETYEPAKRKTFQPEQDVSRGKERKPHTAGDAVVPGLIKSDNPKSIALRGESSFGDLKRKF